MKDLVRTALGIPVAYLLFFEQVVKMLTRLGTEVRQQINHLGSES